MDKFQRNYLLTAQLLNGNYVTVTPPFTVEFNVNKNSFSGCNDFNLRIYNLAQDIRHNLKHDWTNMADRRGIVLQAGYGNVLGTVFNGQITEGFSTREGPNWITSLSGSDGIFALINGKTNYTFAENTPKETMIRTIIAGMPNISVGAIGNSYSQSIPRGNTITQPPYYAMQELTNRDFSVVDGKAYALAATEYIEGSIAKIDASSGLIGTPTRSGSLLVIEMLFEPRIKMFQGVTLQSITGDNVNGFYKVVSVKHRGTISDTVSGEARTILELSQTAVTKVEGT